MEISQRPSMRGNWSRKTWWESLTFDKLTTSEQDAISQPIKTIDPISRSSDFIQSHKNLMLVERGYLVSVGLWKKVEHAFPHII